MGRFQKEISGFLIARHCGHSDFWGFWPTFAAIFFTAFLGGLIIRHRGLAVILNVQQDLKLGYAPAETLIVGACILFAAILLLFPGFVTDVMGFLLLVPIFQQFVISIIRKKIGEGTGPIMPAPQSKGAPIIEGVFNDVTDNRNQEKDETSIFPPNN